METSEAMSQKLTALGCMLGYYVTAVESPTNLLAACILPGVAQTLVTPSDPSRSGQASRDGGHSLFVTRSLPSHHCVVSAC